MGIAALTDVVMAQFLQSALLLNHESRLPPSHSLTSELSERMFGPGILPCLWEDIFALAVLQELHS